LKKKDTTTKQKALTQIIELIKEKESTEINTIVPEWVSLFLKKKKTDLCNEEIMFRRKQNS
jgi:hypothetical protein